MPALTSVITRWEISNNDPDWLIKSLVETVARLPQLTALDISWDECETPIPMGLFSNLSKLTVSCGQVEGFSFISQMATVISNSPHLRSLDVCYTGSGGSRPTLSDIFANVSTKNRLCLEHLGIRSMDATVDQVTFPHLTHLTSFESESYAPIPLSVWTSFLANSIKLSDVVIRGIITEETISYLSSFSGLKKLVIECTLPGLTTKNDKDMLFAMVLPKHVYSLQTLEISGLVIHPIILSQLDSL
jgi:hypothetical protein